MDDDIQWIREEPSQVVVEKPATTQSEEITSEVSKGVTKDEQAAQSKNEETLAQNGTVVAEIQKVQPEAGSNVPAEELPPATKTSNGSVEIQAPPPRVIVAGPEENKNDDVIAWIREEANNRNEAGSLPAPPESPSCRESEVSSAFDISECERKLTEATRDTRELVGKLCEKGDQLQTNNDMIQADLAEQRAILSTATPPHKTIEDSSQVPVVSELPTGGLPRNVESVLIGDGLLSAVSGAVVLPTGRVLVTDTVQGILLYDMSGCCVKKIANPDWRNPRSPLCHKDHIMMLIDIRTTAGENIRHIFKFTVDLEYVARIEGPRWLLDRTVLSDRISIAHTDYLYLSACGEICSAVYELSPVGQWSELDFRQSESYVDMVAFATVGPITQLLVIEGRKSYVLQLSVRESQVVERRRIALCERPGALARDDAGRLFVANRASASIQLVDTIQWVCSKSVAIADAVVPNFSACWGLLAIPIKGNVRLQKYSFR